MEGKGSASRLAKNMGGEGPESRRQWRLRRCGQTSADGSWERMLLARPVRNAAADVRGDGKSGVRITVKKRRPHFLVPPLSWIIRPRLTGAAELDRLGSQVWDLCAGDRTVEEIVDEFARAHGLSFHESRVAVTGYMKLLVERGALAMAM